MGGGGGSLTPGRVAPLEGAGASICAGGAGGAASASVVVGLSVTVSRLSTGTGPEGAWSFRTVTLSKRELTSCAGQLRKPKFRVTGEPGLQETNCRIRDNEVRNQTYIWVLEPGRKRL